MLYYFKSEMYATCQSNCYSLLNDIFVDPQYIRGQKKMFIGLYKIPLMVKQKTMKISQNNKSCKSHNDKFIIKLVRMQN